MRSVGPFLLTDEEFSGLQMFLEKDQHMLGPVMIQLGPRLLAGLDLGTGESGETAEVEAVSAKLENTPAIPDHVAALPGFENLSRMRR